MRSQVAARESPTDATESGTATLGPSADSEITWLLHRAAQRMRNATGDEAERHGLQLRDYIVLSALHKTPNLTQVELGKALGLDKTTLMSQLDRLEEAGLVIRRSDPRDRRARIPAITRRGNTLRAKVASSCASVETAALRNFDAAQAQVFRQMLLEIIGNSEDPGSCL